MPLEAITAHEPIPGYRIRDRLGAGGYGEVWKADAPGGLVKAIKFVYGHLNEERASRELKALSRIKSVRHPFLLSLERIEVVDGQLLIVTELAEKSLKDRFDQCLEQGLPGIPRDELLRYLQDTADVLDYMNEEHCLQHLDIKPENLLLLAGRVKVADFGLVKDLHEATFSIMGGLTPLYAPPEVFDGRPSHWSDQYSLAIVYQEMLTGELPFPGSNAMQLARQHMHSRPRLTALPPADQSVVARALAKTPEQRFTNCRELVHALASAAAHAAHAKLSSVPAAPRNTCQTEFGSDSLGGPNATRAPASARLPRIDPQPQLASAPPLEPVSAEHVTEPILYIGIGGTGARVATKLNQYFASCRDAGMPTPSPCVAVVDTDAKDLAQVARLEQASANPSTDWIPVPLRQPQHYRRDANRLLAWISRRWLFNIPRSLKTDGLRPLGRLALVDHIETIRQHVADALISSSEQTPPSVQQGDRQLESPHGQRVVLVASISGGTGSGMILDLGFLVRQMLEDVGRDDVSVHAILLHSTGRTARWKELAAVNAYATLAELHYFGRLDNSFPGDPSCGLRARPGPATPFDDVNLVHLGADLDEPRFLASIDRVVDHLALDTPHMAGPLFDACRAQAKAAPSTETRLITSGTCVFRCLSPELMTGAVEHICRGVVERWIHGTQVPPKNWLGDSNHSTTSLAASETERPPAGRLTGVVDQWFVDDRYNVEYILDTVARALDTQLQGHPSRFFDARLTSLLSSIGDHHPDPGDSVHQWKEVLTELMGPRWNEEEVQMRPPGVLDAAVKTTRQRLISAFASSLRRRVLALIEDPVSRVRGAVWAAQRCDDYCDTLRAQLRGMETTVEQQLQRIEREFSGLASPAEQGKPLSDHDLRTLLESYSQRRTRQYIVTNSVAVVTALKGHMAGMRDELSELIRRARQLADLFEVDRVSLAEHPPVGDEDALGQLRSSTRNFLAERLTALVEHAEQMIEQSHEADTPSLQRLLTDSGPHIQQIPDQLRNFGRMAVRATMKELNAIEIMFGDDSDPATQTRVLNQCLDAVKPALAACGGAQRLLFMLPESSTNPRPLALLHQTLNELPSATMIPTSDFVICQQIEQVPFTQVAVTLIEQRQDYVEFANRLHTRRDIPWSELPDLV